MLPACYTASEFYVRTEISAVLRKGGGHCSAICGDGLRCQPCESHLSVHLAAEPLSEILRVQWGRYNSDFVLGNRPYVAAAMIGATYVSYNISLYATIPSPNNVSLMPMKAMVMTGSNFSDFQVCLPPIIHPHPLTHACWEVYLRLVNREADSWRSSTLIVSVCSCECGER